MNIPRLLVIGDTISFRDTNLYGSDPTQGKKVLYSPSTHILSYYLRGANQLDVTAIESNGDFLTTISSTQSSSLISGTYYYQATIRDLASTWRVTIGQGQVQASNNVQAISAAYDNRTTAKQMLDALNATIQARLIGGAPVRYLIKGRELWSTPLPELYAIRTQLKIEVAREMAREQGKSGSASYIRFSHY
jgi:hypothetical protein